MSLQTKQCMFCKRILLPGYFNINRASKDNRWAWCKECQKKYGYYEDKAIAYGQKKHVVSFSGGKDSTAMLLKMIEMKMPIDAVVYFDCGSFEWPQMADHIARVEHDTGIEIIKVKSKLDFLELATTLQPENKRINGWPVPALRWCTMIKINLIRQAMRPYRPYIQYIGFSVDENDRVLKASVNQSETNGKKYFSNKFPLVDWNMTEKDCLKYCRDRGYTWDGLYDHFSRVSCWCCPLQNQNELKNLCRYYPDMWDKLKSWDKKMPDPFQSRPGILDKIERQVYSVASFTSVGMAVAS